MKAFVTGANGLLGSALCRELLADGHQVRALVRESSNTRGIDGLDIELVRGDVCDATSMRDGASGCDQMFHLAAVFSYWGYARDEMFKTARDGATNAVDAAKDAGIKRLIVTSSVATLGYRDGPVPLTEADQLSDPDAPDYFKTKLIQEQTTFERANEVGLEALTCNPGVFIGPNDWRPSASLETITGYLGDPMKISYQGGVSLAHAADIARGHILVGADGTPGQRHNLGGDNWLWPDVHRTISELCGVGGPTLTVNRPLALVGATLMELGAKLTRTRPPANRDLARQVGRYFFVDSSKARSIGYDPRPAREALADTIAWLLDSPHLSATARDRLTPSPEVASLRRQPAS